MEFKDEGVDRGEFSERIEKWETLGGGREEKSGREKTKEMKRKEDEEEGEEHRS